MTKASETILKTEKAHQRAAYSNLKRRFAEIYNDLAKNDMTKYVSDNWTYKNNYCYERFYPFPPFEFIMTVSGDMFPATYERDQAEVRGAGRSIFPNTYETVIREELIGDPEVLDEPSLPSHKTIQSAFQLGHYKKIKRYDIPGEASRIVEFGGGYGSLAKMIWQTKANPALTYIMIDTPMFCTMQWLYLSCIFEPEAVIIHSENSPIVEGKINILPTPLASDIDIKGDVFIALYSISESSKAAQDLVYSTNWFECQRLLMAYQMNSERFPIAERIKILVEESRENTHVEVASPFSWYIFA